MAINFPATTGQPTDGSFTHTDPTTGLLYFWDGSSWSSFGTPAAGGGGGTSLPSGTTDGEALIWENGAWDVGPAIGGVNYTPSGGVTSNSTVPTGFSIWDDAWTSPAATNITLSNNDRTATADNSSEKLVWSPSAKSSGKWYVEFALGNISSDMVVGLSQSNNNTIPGISPSTGFGIRQGGGSFNQLSGATIDAGYSQTWGYSNYIMIAVDFDAKYFWFGVNGTWQNSGDPAAGTGYVISNWSGTPSYYVGVRLYNASESATWEAYNIPQTPVSIPYSIDKLDDVDTSTVAPTDGQALLWDNTAQKWEPGTVSGGGGGTPGGNNEEVQYNSSGSFAGSNALKFSLNTTSVPNTATLVVGDNPGNPAQSFRGELVADNINAQGIITSINGAYFNGTVTVEGIGPNTSLQLVSGGSPVAILDNNYSPGTAGQVLSATGNDGSGNATGVAWATPSTLSGRQTASAQTASIADGVAADLSITAAKSYGLITIQTSHAAWVTLYTDAASRTADASRTENTDALPGTGVIAEVITGGATTQLMTPGVFGFNNDSTPSTTVYAKVVNKSGSTQVITVTLTYTILEV